MIPDPPGSNPWGYKLIIRICTDPQGRYCEIQCKSCVARYQYLPNKREKCSKQIQISHFEFVLETGSVLCRIVIWDCFEEAISSLIG